MPRVGFRHSQYSIDLMRRAQRSNRPSLAERFYERIEFDPFGGCWLWSGALPAEGYGTIQHEGRTLTVHRLSYELHVGPIPSGLLVRHRCDVRACCNPAHLLVGTHRDNERDKIVRGRRHPLIGEAHPGAKLRASDIPIIRGRLRAGHTCRQIGDDYGVDQCAINAIRRGRSWRHVLGVTPLAAQHGVTFSDPNEEAA